MCLCFCWWQEEEKEDEEKDLLVDEAKAICTAVARSVSAFNHKTTVW